MLPVVFYRLLAGHAPFAGGRDDFHLRREGVNAYLEPHLVVALAGAAVGDGGRAFSHRYIHQQLGHKRPCQRRRQRVLPFIKRIGLQRREDKILNKIFLGVDNFGFNRADFERLLFNGGEIFFIANVNRHGNNIDIIFFLEP